MNDVIVKEKIIIEKLIYEIRGKQVMLDGDLAKLYEVETKRINEAVKRNPEKFPERFCFRLTEEEYLNKSGNLRGKNLKYLPFVFTEQGVAMLATILKTPIATKISIKIMDAFVSMRHYIGNNEYRLSNVESKLIEHDKNI